MFARVRYDDTKKAESVVPLVGDLVTFVGPRDDQIGRPNVHVLDHPRIEGTQFFLTFDRENWWLHHRGRVDTRLDGEPRSPTSAVLLRIPARIRVLGITITISETAVPPARAEKAAVAAIGQEEGGWRGFQMRVKQDLDQQILIDLAGTRLDSAGPEHRALIDRRLRDFLAGHLARATPAELDGIAGMSLRRWLMLMLMRPAPQSGQRGNHDVEQVVDTLRAALTDFDGDGDLTAIFENAANAVTGDLEFDPGLTGRAALLDRLAKFDSRAELAIPNVLSGLSTDEKRRISARAVYLNIWDVLFGVGPLTDVMRMELVTEVLVARYDRVYVERDGLLQRYDYAFASEGDLHTIIDRMVDPTGRRFNESSAMIDFQHVDRSRVNIVGKPLATEGAALTIRKFPKNRNASIHQYTARFHPMSAAMTAFLAAAVAARANIMVSGGTGTGKTTLLNALARSIPENERIVTIEDTAELVLGDRHVVALQSRTKNDEGSSAVTIRDLVRNALRMRPDRIVVGECRGGEALDMLQAMNTGHAGSMSTAHANSPAEMILRLETLVMQAGESLPSRAIRQQIVAGIDLIVQLSRLPDGRRRVTEIAEVVALDPETDEVLVEPVFRHRSDGRTGLGRFVFTGYVPTLMSSMLDAAGRLGVSFDELLETQPEEA